MHTFVFPTLLACPTTALSPPSREEFRVGVAFSGDVLGSESSPGTCTGGHDGRVASLQVLHIDRRSEGSDWRGVPPPDEPPPPPEPAQQVEQPRCLFIAELRSLSAAVPRAERVGGLRGRQEGLPGRRRARAPPCICRESRASRAPC